ncbi:MAG TPA: hypothetical protein VLT88_16145, partial [Desulfosarcina sp.]|nr:hypothetical protein [Desulfosarcina sp.]
MATIRVFNHYLRIPFVMLGLIEFFVLAGSIYGAAYIRYYNATEDMSGFLVDMLPRALFFAITVVFCMTAMGLYQARLREGMSGVMLRTVVSFLLGGAVMSVGFYAFPDLFLGRGVLVLAALLSFFVIGTIRPIFFDSVDESMLKRRVIIYGAGRKAAAILKRLRRKSDQRSFHMLGFIEVPGVERAIHDRRIIHLNQPLVDFALANQV